jgi:winged helix DNA-binding protein
MRSLTWPEVIARRVARSHLLEPAPRGQLLDVVRDVALVQAQVLPAAELGIGVRVRGVSAADVRAELYERRTLVKTWSIRGTLHLVPADELPLWAAAARGPDPSRPAPVDQAIAGALDGRCLTRQELAEAVGDDRLLSGWGELLWTPAVTGKLCFGPPRGANVTFVRADQWIGGWRDVDPLDARREVLGRYLRAYGPATPDDFRRWSGFGRDDSRALFEEADLEEVRVEGRRAWLLADDDDGFEDGAGCVRLLPRYDAYVLGFRPREALVPGPVKERIAQDPRGRFETVTGMSPLVVDGVVTGLWRKTKETELEIEHVLPLPRGRKRELDAAVARVEELLG